MIYLHVYMDTCKNPGGFDLVSAIDSIKYGHSYCDNTHYFFEILF